MLYISYYKRDVQNRFPRWLWKVVLAILKLESINHLNRSERILGILKITMWSLMLDIWAVVLRENHLVCFRALVTLISFCAVWTLLLPTSADVASLCHKSSTVLSLSHFVFFKICMCWSHTFRNIHTVLPFVRTLRSIFVSTLLAERPGSPFMDTLYIQQEGSPWLFIRRRT